MITFDTDDCLVGPMPTGLTPALWGVARDVAEEHLHDEMCTFFVPESANDLYDGGPISEPVSCGGNLASAIAHGDYRPERHVLSDGAIVWAVPITISGYRADVLLIPEAEWLPTDIQDALKNSHQRGDRDDD